MHYGLDDDEVTEGIRWIEKNQKVSLKDLKAAVDP